MYRFDFTPRNGEADYTGESKPIFSAGHGEKVPPIPPKKKISTHKPVGIVAPFNHNLEVSFFVVNILNWKFLKRLLVLELLIVFFVCLLNKEIAATVS